MFFDDDELELNMRRLRSDYTAKEKAAFASGVFAALFEKSIDDNPFFNPFYRQNDEEMAWLAGFTNWHFMNNSVYQIEIRSDREPMCLTLPRFEDVLELEYA